MTNQYDMPGTRVTVNGPVPFAKFQHDVLTVDFKRLGEIFNGQEGWQRMIEEQEQRISQLETKVMRLTTEIYKTSTPWWRRVWRRITAR